MFYPTTDHISNCYLVVTRNRHFCREIDALFSRRFLAFPASVNTACASLNLRPHLLLLSMFLLKAPVEEVDIQVHFRKLECNISTSWGAIFFHPRLVISKEMLTFLTWQCFASSWPAVAIHFKI